MTAQPNPDSEADVSRFVAYTNRVQSRVVELTAILEASACMVDCREPRVLVAALQLIPVAVEIANEINSALDSVNTWEVLA